MKYDFSWISINFIKNLSGTVYLKYFIFGELLDFALRGDFYLVFCMSRNTLMFQSGIKTNLPKKRNFSQNYGAFSVERRWGNQGIHKKPHLRQCPKSFSCNNYSHSKEQQTMQSDESGRTLRTRMFLSFHKGICNFV